MPTPLTPPQYELPPELEAQVKEAIERINLLDSVESDALAWINDRALGLIRDYANSAVDWLSKALNRASENEPLSDRERMFIWVVAYHLVKSTPKSLSAEQFEKWVFCLLSLGYVMRMDHESSSQKNGPHADTGTPSA